MTSLRTTVCHIRSERPGKRRPVVMAAGQAHGASLHDSNWKWEAQTYYFIAGTQPRNAETQRVGCPQSLAPLRHGDTYSSLGQPWIAQANRRCRDALPQSSIRDDDEVRRPTPPCTCLAQLCTDRSPLSLLPNIQNMGAPCRCGATCHCVRARFLARSGGPFLADADRSV